MLFSVVHIRVQTKTRDTYNHGYNIYVLEKNPMVKSSEPAKDGSSKEGNVGEIVGEGRIKEKYAIRGDKDHRGVENTQELEGSGRGRS
jgi:hypothetical protein